MKGEPAELQGKGRSDLIWEIERARELYKQATSQCTRAQQEREVEKRRAKKLVEALRRLLATPGSQSNGGCHICHRAGHTDGCELVAARAALADYEGR